MKKGKEGTGARRRRMKKGRAIGTRMKRGQVGSRRSEGGAEEEQKPSPQIKYRRKSLASVPKNASRA
eukprot:6201204-Pleurochrysis_carterae.AAC.1